ncbi:hypothetical protein NL676_007294 [Syzygium grande]|nr:hypothetical protein NL676_007294 [Syzygium grande]
MVQIQSETRENWGCKVMEKNGIERCLAETVTAPTRLEVAMGNVVIVETSKKEESDNAGGLELSRSRPPQQQCP